MDWIGEPGCIRLRNDLYCVEWGVKLYSLTMDWIGFGQQKWTHVQL